MSSSAAATKKKTPIAVSDAIKKLSASDQVAVRTYIAGLKSTIDDLESELSRLNDDDDDEGYEVIDDEDDDAAHAHYHGHERCTGDHGHHGHHHHHDEHHDAPRTAPKWKTEASSSSAPPFGGTWDAESSVDASAPSAPVPEGEGEGDMPPMYSGDGSADDHDKAAAAKEAASDLKSSGEYDLAVERYTEAILAASPSALLLANRAHCLFLSGRLAAAIRDCDAALDINPDSAKALRMRGESRASRGEYHLSLKDLAAAQQVDYDDEAARMLREVTEKVGEIDAEKVRKRNAEEEKLRERAEGIKRAQEEARMEREREREEDERRKREQRRGAGGMPGMGGGMPGMGGMEGMMAGLMSDPEIAAGMKNPKVMKAFQDLMSGPGGPMGLMSNPGKLQEMMADPEVGPFMQKLMGKVMGGGLGGMGGMPGMSGGAGGGGWGGGGGDDDDIPDLDGDEMPDLVD